MSGDNLSVKTMTQLTGLNEHTLRAWERRYGAVKPKRGETGRRIYSRLDVDRLRTIATLVERGFAIGRIATLSDQALAELLAEHMALDQPVAPKVAPSEPSGYEQRAEELSQRIQGALIRYDLAAIHSALQIAQHLLGARSFALDLVVPLMAQVSRLTVAGPVTTCQERALSAIVKAHLAGITLGMSPLTQANQSKPPAFIIATMEGNFHEIAIMIAALVALTRGAHVFYVGANIPARAVAEVANTLQADNILLGSNALPPGTLPVSEAHYLRELEQMLQRDSEIWVSGAVATEVKTLALRRPLRLFANLKEFDAALAAGTWRR